MPSFELLTMLARFIITRKRLALLGTVLIMVYSHNGLCILPSVMILIIQSKLDVRLDLYTKCSPDRRPSLISHWIMAVVLMRLSDGEGDEIAEDIERNLAPCIMSLGMAVSGVVSITIQLLNLFHTIRLAELAT